MFTGIVHDVGTVRRLERKDGDARLSIKVDGLDLADVEIGESINVAGACLTVTGLDSAAFDAEISAETLERTTLGELAAGSRVNLERALRVGDRLGGHLVSGHVDGTGEVLALTPDGASRRLELRIPAELAQYVAEKGSLAVDGVSLTVNGVQGEECHCNLVPHTLSATTLDGLESGRRVNLEVDLVARYLARILEYHGLR